MGKIGKHVESWPARKSQITIYYDALRQIDRRHVPNCITNAGSGSWSAPGLSSLVLDYEGQVPLLNLKDFEKSRCGMWNIVVPSFAS